MFKPALSVFKITLLSFKPQGYSTGLQEVHSERHLRGVGTVTGLSLTGRRPHTIHASSLAMVNRSTAVHACAARACETRSLWLLSWGTGRFSLTAWKGDSSRHSSGHAVRVLGLEP